MSFQGQAASFAPGILSPEFLAPNCGIWKADGAKRGFLGEQGVDVNCFRLLEAGLLVGFESLSPMVIVVGCALLKNRGCVFVAVDRAGEAFAADRLPVRDRGRDRDDRRLLGDGEALFSILLIPPPIRTRESSSLPYLTVTRSPGPGPFFLDGRGDLADSLNSWAASFGFGGDPKVPVFKLNLSSFFGVGDGGGFSVGVVSAPGFPFVLLALGAAEDAGAGSRPSSPPSLWAAGSFPSDVVGGEGGESWWRRAKCVVIILPEDGLPLFLGRPGRLFSTSPVSASGCFLFRPRS